MAQHPRGDALITMMLVSSDVCIKAGIELSDDVVLWLEDTFKSVATYGSALRKLVRDLYTGKTTELNFATDFMSLIAAQFRRAFLEGMRLNGLTSKDMEPDWEYTLDLWIQEEHDYILQFGDAIVDAANNAGDINPLLSRSDLWVNRYNEIVDRARILTADAEQKFEWVYGDTIEHCDTCGALAGKVLYAREWQALHDRGIYPKSRSLACHGYNCDCRVQPTDKRRSAGGLSGIEV